MQQQEWHPRSELQNLGCAMNLDYYQLVNSILIGLNAHVQGSEIDVKHFVEGQYVDIRGKGFVAL